MYMQAHKHRFAHTNISRRESNCVFRHLANKNVVAVDVDNWPTILWRVTYVCLCICVGVCVNTEGECDKNMKDSLIWINLEHENETDRQTRRSRQGELCWVLNNEHTWSHTQHITDSVEQECHCEARLLQERPAEAWGSKIYNFLKWIKWFQLQFEPYLTHDFSFDYQMR